MISYFKNNNKNSIKLSNHELIYDIINCDQKLFETINNYYYNQSLIFTVNNLYIYIKTIDLLIQNMKDSFELNDKDIKYFIVKYLKNHKITQFNINIYCLNNNCCNHDIMNIFSEIFYDEVIKCFDSIRRYKRIKIFLKENKSKSLKLWIMDEFIQKNGVDGIKKILTNDKSVKTKILLKDIAIIIKKNFIKIT